MSRILLFFMVIAFSQTAFGKEWKNFNLPVFSKNEHYSLADHGRKKKVVINFWASWCTACIKELDELEALKKNNPNVEFVAINAGESRKTIKKFLRKRKFSYIILEDKNKAYSKSVGVLELPYTVVVGKSLKVLYEGKTPPKEL